MKKKAATSSKVHEKELNDLVQSNSIFVANLSLGVNQKHACRAVLRWLFVVSISTTSKINYKLAQISVSETEEQNNNINK